MSTNEKLFSAVDTALLLLKVLSLYKYTDLTAIKITVD